jgi:hypothetical protein
MLLDAAVATARELFNCLEADQRIDSGDVTVVQPSE